MADEEKTVKEEYHHGIQMTESELAEYEDAFQEIEESIGLVMVNGEDL